MKRTDAARKRDFRNLAGAIVLVLIIILIILNRKHGVGLSQPSVADLREGQSSEGSLSIDAEDLKSRTRKTNQSKLQNGADPRVDQQNKNRVSSQKIDKVSEKLRVDLKLLLISNSEIGLLNPDIDLTQIDLNDPRYLKIKLPKGTNLVGLKDPNCTSEQISGFGAAKSDPLAESIDQVRSPSFVSIKTGQEQTIESLSQSVSSNSCILGVFANGSLSSVALPYGTKDVTSFMPSGSDHVPMVYDYQSLLKDGAALLTQRAAEGHFTKVQVYILPTQASVNGGPAFDPVLPVNIQPVGAPASTTEEYVLAPGSGDSSEQIANLNNRIVLAVSKGADYILTPYVNPNSISASLKYASDHGVKVVLMPQNTQSPTRAPSSKIN